MQHETRGGTDTEIRVSTQSRHWRRKFSQGSCRDSNPRLFTTFHESGALTIELSPPHGPRVCVRACVRACVCQSVCVCVRARARARARAKVCFDCVLLFCFMMGYVLQLTEIVFHCKALFLAEFYASAST